MDIRTRICLLCLYVFLENIQHTNTHSQWPSLHSRGCTYKHYLINHKTRWKRVLERGRVWSILLDILLYINLIEMDNTQHLHQWLTATQTTRHPSRFDLSHSQSSVPLEDHCFLVQEAIIKTKEMQGRVADRPFGAYPPPPKTKHNTLCLGH